MGTRAGTPELLRPAPPSLQSPEIVLSLDWTTMASERFLQAASSGETAVVASMLRNPDLDSPGKRALLEATTEHGHCALHVAALNGHAGVVNMLIKAGADSQAKTRFGKTPLACAESGNHHEVIKLLTPEKTRREGEESVVALRTDVICESVEYIFRVYNCRRRWATTTPPRPVRLSSAATSKSSPSRCEGRAVYSSACL